MISTTAMMGMAYGLSEIGLSVLKRARSGDVVDRGSFRMLWMTIVGSLFAAFIAPHSVPQANFSTSGGLYEFGVGLFVAGLSLRWLAIFWLGKFFTVKVTIASDHRVIDTGPYRFVRHPSYTGALAAFLGLGICVGNWVSLLVIMIPITWAFIKRIDIEEVVLRSALDGPYAAYSRRTRRLVPFVY